MFLYLVRHGIALDREDPHAPSDDTQRPLTPEGIKKTYAVAKGFRALDGRPSAFLTSPWLRARQTAEIFCEVFGAEPERIRALDALKGTSNPADLYHELDKIKAKEVMCFGHEPHLHLTIALALHAASGLMVLKKAGIACLELDRVSPPHGQLVFLYPPKILRTLGR